MTKSIKGRRFFLACGTTLRPHIDRDVRVDLLLDLEEPVHFSMCELVVLADSHTAASQDLDQVLDALSSLGCTGYFTVRTPSAHEAGLYTTGPTKRLALDKWTDGHLFADPV